MIEEVWKPKRVIQPNDRETAVFPKCPRRVTWNALESQGLCASNPNQGRDLKTFIFNKYPQVVLPWSEVGGTLKYC